MKLLTENEISKVSGGYDNTSVSLTFNVPLNAAPVLAEAFPNMFSQNSIDLDAFVNAVNTLGLDPTQIQVEVYIYRGFSN